jgi:hypothetical protein
VNLVTNSAAASNPALLPPASLVLSGTGANRTLTVSPPAGQSGTATVTLTVVNPAGAVCSEPVAVTVTPAPPAVSALSWQNGDWQFQISGATGFNYTVQASTNLMTWSNLFVTNPAAMPFTWRDTNTQVFPQRFYRVLLGP